MAKKKPEDEAFLNAIEFYLRGMEDTVLSGYDGWKSSFLQQASDMRNEITKYRSINAAPEAEKKYEPKEGLPEERLYVYFIRKFKEYPIENLFKSDFEIMRDIEAQLDEVEVSGLKTYFYKFFYTGQRALDKAFKKIIVTRRKEHKQQKLF